MAPDNNRRIAASRWKFVPVREFPEASNTTSMVHDYAKFANKVSFALMPAAQYPGLDRVIDGDAILRIVVGIDHQLTGALQQPVAVMRQMTKL